MKDKIVLIHTCFAYLGKHPFSLRGARASWVVSQPRDPANHRNPKFTSLVTFRSCVHYLRQPSTMDFPKEEERILEFWREIDAFRTSVKLSEGKQPYSFYDGPPFCTGLVDCPFMLHLRCKQIWEFVADGCVARA